MKNLNLNFYFVNTDTNTIESKFNHAAKVFIKLLEEGKVTVCTARRIISVDYGVTIMETYKEEFIAKLNVFIGK